MDKKYCEQQYTTPGDSALFCRTQIKIYKGEPLHVLCDKTRQNAALCSFLEQNRPKCTDDKKYVGHALAYVHDDKGPIRKPLI